MEHLLVASPISLDAVHVKAREIFGDYAKAVVDVERGVMMLGGEMHVDLEQQLLEHGSRQQDLWGINLYPDKNEADWIEYDSMINLRPRQGNCSRGVEDAATRARIADIVKRLVTRP